MFDVGSVLQKNVIWVTRETPIYEAIRILVENNITGLPVVDEDMTLAGIISEKDMLKLLYNVEDRQGNVEDFMTRDVIWFDENSSLIDICECFIKHHFRRVPILSNNKLIGIVSRKDIIKYILRLRRKDKAPAACK